MDTFEKASYDTEKDRDITLVNENVIEFIKNSKTATVCFTQGRYIAKIKKLKEKFPDKIEICDESEGVLVAHIPVTAIKINIAEPREMTEEHRAAVTEGLRKYRESKKEDITQLSDT